MIKLLNIAVWILLLSTTLTVGCSRNIYAVSHENISYLDDEHRASLSLQMHSFFGYYYKAYWESPKTVDDIMRHIKTLYKYEQGYAPTYGYLKKNRRHLIIADDSVFGVYYKEVKFENCIHENTGAERNCDRLNREDAYMFASVDLFDKDGYWVHGSEKMDKDSLFKQLYSSYWKYYQKYRHNPNDEHVDGSKMKWRYIEYTAEGLKDKCDNRTLDIDSAPYLKNYFNLLDSVAKKNKLSRIVVTGYIDN